MQKNDFEKQVQQKLDDFSLLPADAVWEKVAAKIEADKKRRRILFFWLFAGILLVGGGTGMYMLSDINDNKLTANSNETKLNAKKNEVEKSKGKINFNEDKPAIAEDKMIEESTAISKKDQLSKDEKYATLVSKQPENQAKKITQKIKHVEKLKATVEEKIESRIKEFEASPGKIESREQEGLDKPSTTVIPTTFTPIKIEASEKPAIDSAKKTLQQTVENKIPTSKKVVKRNTKPFLFGLSIFGGISDNVSASLLPSTKSADRALQFSGPITNQASQNDVANYNYSNSFSWGFGGFVRKELTKKMSISLGVNYHLITASSKIGVRVDSAKSYQDSALKKTAVVNTFYRGGSANSFKNNYHFIQVPVDVLFRLNRNTEKPLTLSAGITGNFLVGSSALYLNTKARNFYKEEDHLKHFTLGVQAGLSFTVIQNKKYSINTGPTFQYQLSNLTKPVINTNEHLLFVGLKGNILFKKNK